MLFPIASAAETLTNPDGNATVNSGRDKTLDRRIDQPDGMPSDAIRFGVTGEAFLHTSEALQQTGLRELASIRIQVSDCELTLDGEVGSFYLKQLATEAVRPHACGLRIKNRLQVPEPVRRR